MFARFRRSSAPTRTIIAAVLAPLALGLAACSKEEASGPAASATALPNVPAPAGTAWTEVVETTADGGYLVGNPQAAIKLVEYGSLSCPHCARLAQEGYQKLMGEYVASGRVSLEFRSYAIHSVDIPLTMLAACGPKESFFPLIEQVYGNFDEVIGKSQSEEALNAAQKAMGLPENQRFAAAADAQGFTQFFAQRGISVDQAHACLARFDKATEIANHAKAYGEAGIESTPTLVINGSTIAGNTWAELDAALQRAGVR